MHQVQIEKEVTACAVTSFSLKTMVFFVEALKLKADVKLL